MNPLLLLIIPLASAIVIHFLLKQKLASIAAVLGTLATAATLAISYLQLGSTATVEPFTWASVGDFKIEIGLELDQLSKGMMIVVTGIGFLVHLFSLGYMKSDDAKARYFGNLSLFMFSMTGIVLASNFVMMFIFWELVGLSSYLLIGHWYQKDSAADAAKKAFLSNRVGDFGFLIGILMIWGIASTTTFGEMSIAAGTPFLGAAVLLVFCGAIGKSAQLPLHTWLPDAMEGPTPVSALIHAATMVAAGVYMMARFFYAVGLDVIPECSAMTIAWIGGITSLLAALMATQQNDIKKILAYSTLSQLGYMVMAVGLVDPNAGMFHLYTHAWFKALLFLGSGAVIYACHHEQDIWKMGGLIKKMPITSITFIIGTLALTAVPFFSGFYSKEGILMAADKAGSPLLYVAVAVAALTTFYMFRLIFVAFFGKARGHGAEEAKEVSPLMLLPLVALAVMAVASPHIANLFPAADASQIHVHLVPNFGDHLVIMSLVAFAIGFIAAVVLYNGKQTEPLNIPLFRNKFYLDEIYAKIVKGCQDLVATVVHFLDEFIISGMIVGGLTRIAQGTGNIFRHKMQTGSIQSYAMLFGAGIILVITIVVFV